MWEDSTEKVAQRTLEDSDEDSRENSGSSTNDRQECKCKFLSNIITSNSSSSSKNMWGRASTHLILHMSQEFTKIKK